MDTVSVVKETAIGKWYVSVVHPHLPGFSNLGYQMK